MILKFHRYKKNSSCTVTDSQIVLYRYKETTLVSIQWKQLLHSHWFTNVSCIDTWKNDSCTGTRKTTLVQSLNCCLYGYNKNELLCSHCTRLLISLFFIIAYVFTISYLKIRTWPSGLFWKVFLTRVAPEHISHDVSAMPGPIPGTVS